MPFITKSTFNRIVSEIDLKAEPFPSKLRLEGKNLTILSKKELQRLALITEILGSEYIPENRFFLKIEKPNDSYTLVHPERVPSYHTEKNCSGLTKEYENYLVPIEIREQGIPSVTKFRKFFFDNNNLFNENKNDFFLKTRKEFGLTQILTTEDFIELKAPNSGRGSIENFNLKDLEEKLDTAITEAENFKYEGPINQLTIAKYGNIYKPSLNNPDEIKIIAKWSELKRYIKSSYILFSMVKNNPEINIDGNFLDSLGLKKCSLCNKQEKYFDFIGMLNEK